MPTFKAFNQEEVPAYFWKEFGPSLWEHYTALETLGEEEEIEFFQKWETS